MNTEQSSQLLRQKLFYFGYIYNNTTKQCTYTNEANYVQKSIDFMGRFPEQIVDLYCILRKYFKNNIQNNENTSRLKKFFAKKFNHEKISIDTFYNIFVEDDKECMHVNPRTKLDFERMTKEIEKLPQNIKNSLFNEKKAEFRAVKHEIELILNTHSRAVNSFKTYYDVVNDINTKLQDVDFINENEKNCANLVNNTQELCANNYAKTLTQSNAPSYFETALNLCNTINESKNAKIDIPDTPIYLDNPKFTKTSHAKEM